MRHSKAAKEVKDTLSTGVGPSAAPQPDGFQATVGWRACLQNEQRAWAVSPIGLSAGNIQERLYYILATAKRGMDVSRPIEHPSLSYSAFAKG